MLTTPTLLLLLAPLSFAQEGGADPAPAEDAPPAAEDADATATDAPAETGDEAPADAAPTDEPATPTETVEAAVEVATEAPAEQKPEKGPKQWQWAALPIANYTSTYGLGYGFYANIVNNGKEDMGDEPYAAQFALQLYWTTGSYYDHFLKADFPAIFGSKFRWDVQGGLTNWDTANYFGEGNFTPRRLGDECPTEGDLPEVGCTPYLYYNYGQNGFKVLTNLRREITGPWSAFLNARVQQFNTTIYRAGDTPELGKDPPTVTEDSLVAVTEPFGYEGGMYLRTGVGVMYDTRDQEPSPTGGMWTEASVRWGGMVTGESGSNIGVNLTDRRFWGFGKRKRAVIASRVILDMKWGDEPVFMGAVMGGSQDITIGSSTAMRGLPNSRVIGDGAIVWTPEGRFTVASPHIGSNVLDIMLGPYFDTGRVWLWPDSENPADADSPEKFYHLHYAGGLASRFVWNTNMVVRLDLGYGVEEYLNLATQEVEYGPNMGINLVFDHPF